MKRVSLILILFVLNTFTIFAQETGGAGKLNTGSGTPVSTTAKPKLKVKLDQNAQVRDAGGMEYPYAVWYKLLRGGKHGFKLLDGKNPNAPIFLVYPLSLQEIESRQERLPKPMDSGAFKEGDSFKYFSFRDTENKKFKKEDLEDKVLVINFWFINCAPCRQEIPDLNDLAEEYKDNENVVFIAIGLDAWVDVKEFIKKTPFNYHLLTEGRFIANSYGVNGYPTNIVVDTAGKIAFQSKGGSIANPLWIRRAIDTSLK